MNKIGMVFILLLSASSFATEKADFNLKWQEEPRREAGKADFKLKWQEEPRREVAPTKNNDLQGYMNERNIRQQNFLGHVDKANRLRFTDPQFSTYNSDGGSHIYIRR